MFSTRGRWRCPQVLHPVLHPSLHHLNALYSCYVISTLAFYASKSKNWSKTSKNWQIWRRWLKKVVSISCFRKLKKRIFKIPSKRIKQFISPQSFIPLSSLSSRNGVNLFPWFGKVKEIVWIIAVAGRGHLPCISSWNRFLEWIWTISYWANAEICKHWKSF